VLLWAVEVGEVADLYGVAGGQGYVRTLKVRSRRSLMSLTQ
jgi:hypothetical protein